MNINVSAALKLIEEQVCEVNDGGLSVCLSD